MPKQKQFDLFDQLVSESKAFKDIKPISTKRRGRPKGSKNRGISSLSRTPDLQSGKEGANPSFSTKVDPDPIVEIMVNPIISINGTDYLGAVKVRQSIANTINHMMYAHRQGEARVTQGIIHKTIDLGEV